MDRRDEAIRLGFYAAAPFVFGAAALWLSPLVIPQWAALNLHTLILAYGGILAAYQAGIGAGAAFRPGAPGGAASGLVAALAAWFAIWPGGFLIFSAPAVWRYLVLILVFVYLLRRDLDAAARGEFPSWYGALRIRLTLWTVVALALMMIRLATWSYY